MFVLWQPQRNRTVCQRGFLLDIHRVKLMWNMATSGRWQGSWRWIQQIQYTKWNISYYLQTLSTFSVHHCLVTTYETQIFLFPGFALYVLASSLLLPITPTVKTVLTRTGPSSHYLSLDKYKTEGPFKCYSWKQISAQIAICVTLEVLLYCLKIFAYF